MKISEVSKAVNLSQTTLRYYEKISLLKIKRDPAGIRCYTQADISKLHFIQRAKAMNFTLDEIYQLLVMRENPAKAKQSIRELTRSKLQEVEIQLKTLSTLKKELTLLTNLCTGSEEGCPIIDDMNNT